MQVCDYQLDNSFKEHPNAEVMDNLNQLTQKCTYEEQAHVIIGGVQKEPNMLVEATSCCFSILGPHRWSQRPSPA